MVATKRKQQTLLTTVARGLGVAAGTVTRITKELAHNVSATPSDSAGKINGSAPAKVATKDSQNPKRRAAAKKVGRTARTNAAKSQAGPKRKIAKGKLAQPVRPSARNKSLRNK
jgi:hypothetical protein